MAALVVKASMAVSSLLLFIGEAGASAKLRLFLITWELAIVMSFKKLHLTLKLTIEIKMVK